MKLLSEGVVEQKGAPGVQDRNVFWSMPVLEAGAWAAPKPMLTSNELFWALANWTAKSSNTSNEK
jgi:hypothetical protein